ncbi:hypothetical protein CHU32_00085 [Superficieibacter electus]|uniref:Flagellar protein n=1 Tax=Superficieibacter electus TaxID=2022662 RepID=A0A2P5GVQ1_9ENTR|nr:flagellar biosynthetic protein FliO [Superficieibacter electus]POP47592.1 hypothetical protein CHU33_00085 [Superficieibacter electus]POP50603.1 hypothetical protein CHU32_00085 [Superficieibacter electus]
MKTQATVVQPVVSPASSLMQVSGALLGIIFLILVVAWVVKRTGFGGKGSAARGLKVSAGATLGPRERIVIVEVEDARLVLGVTAAQISLLHTLPPAAPDTPQATPATADFSSIMKNLLTRSGRS